MAANLNIDEYVMKVYRGEPLTEAPETEPLTESEAYAEGMEGQEMPMETILEDGTVIAGGTAPVAEGGTVETLADGTIVAPRAPAAETQTETEKPVQTLENSVVNVSMTMTFYETAYNAPSLDGLIIETPEAPQEQAG